MTRRRLERRRWKWKLMEKMENKWKKMENDVSLAATPTPTLAPHPPFAPLPVKSNSQPSRCSVLAAVLLLCRDAFKTALLFPFVPFAATFSGFPPHSLHFVFNEKNAGHKSSVKMCDM